jgi:hypothetical protein
MPSRNLTGFGFDLAPFARHPLAKRSMRLQAARPRAPRRPILDLSASSDQWIQARPDLEVRDFTATQINPSRSDQSVTAWAVDMERRIT